MSLGTVSIRSGLVEGVPCGNPAYTVFKGIPYAKPPVGEYRWKSPEDPEPWDGVKKCDTFSAVSIQKKPISGEFYQKEFWSNDVPMSEDCLYLNVWTPSFTGSEKLPVMMWIHGGAYISGYSYEMEFDGEAFCKRGVILVTINYRLGALGFFAHPELSGRSLHNVSGNYGILDQIQALKWIKNNIAAFGGDPDNVTIFGQSAGGGAVQSITSSPLSKGLIHKAIIQSAGSITTLGGNITLQDAEKTGVEICEKAGKSFEELRKMPAAELHDLVEKALTPPGSPYPMLKMMPNTDGYVLPDNPGTALAFGKHHNIDYMTGSVSGDDWLFGGKINQTKDEFESSVRKMYGDYAARYLKLFNVQNDADLDRVQSARAKATSMLAPRCWAKVHIKQGRKPVYIYYFDRDMPGEDHPGAFHSSELWYIFGTITRCWRPMEAVDYKISLTMTDYWTNFAKNGDPNGEGLPKWSAFTDETPVTMRINENRIAAVDTSGDPIADGMEDLLFEQVYKNI